MGPTRFRAHAQHVQREHIKEEVCNVAMHKHVRKNLVRSELVGKREMQPEIRVKIDAGFVEHKSTQQHQHIYDNQVFYNNRYGIKRWPVIHNLFIVLADSAIAEPFYFGSKITTICHFEKLFSISVTGMMCKTRFPSGEKLGVAQANSSSIR